MNYDFYLFDLDGTLLDLGNIGAYADQVMLGALQRLNIEKIPDRNERSEFWRIENNFEQVLKKWGIRNSDAFWKAYDKTDFEKRKILLLNKKISLFEGAETVLELIYNHKITKKLAICTNTADYIVDFFLKHFKINHFFHEIFSMGVNNQDFAKPSPKGIFTILKRFKFDPRTNSAIMVGDSIHDIKAAKEAKISSCLINHRKNNEFDRYKHWKIQPTYIIKNLNELIYL
ncbi:MAG: HAD family hydrolase [Promethearchaeota archaeon]